MMVRRINQQGRENNGVQKILKANKGNAEKSGGEKKIWRRDLTKFKAKGKEELRKGKAIGDIPQARCGVR